MTITKQTTLSKSYVIVVALSALVLPIISVIIEITFFQQHLSVQVIGKWFIFYAVGFRLLLAGIKQVTEPAFTAKQIFHIEDASSYPVVRELGFANLCFGLIGIVSLFIPQWRIVSAFGSGLYYGIAALNHIVKKPAGANEKLALVSDVFIFLVLLTYVIFTVAAPTF